MGNAHRNNTDQAPQDSPEREKYANDGQSPSPKENTGSPERVKCGGYICAFTNIK